MDLKAECAFVLDYRCTDTPGGGDEIVQYVLNNSNMGSGSLVLVYMCTRDKMCLFTLHRFKFLKTEEGAETERLTTTLATYTNNF